MECSVPDSKLSLWRKENTKKAQEIKKKRQSTKKRKLEKKKEPQTNLASRKKTSAKRLREKMERNDRAQIA